MEKYSAEPACPQLILSLSSFFTGLSMLWVTQAFSEAFLLLIYCFNIVGLKVLTSKHSSPVPLFSDWSHLRFASSCPGFSDCKIKTWELHSQFWSRANVQQTHAALALFWDHCAQSIFRPLSVFQKQAQRAGRWTCCLSLPLPLFVLASFWPPNLTVNFTSTESCLWVELRPCLPIFL